VHPYKIVKKTEIHSYEKGSPSDQPLSLNPSTCISVLTSKGSPKFSCASPGFAFKYSFLSGSLYDIFQLALSSLLQNSSGQGSLSSL
jgi:hypothetical protein